MSIEQLNNIHNDNEDNIDDSIDQFLDEDGMDDYIDSIKLVNVQYFIFVFIFVLKKRETNL